jgi:hypothetical protein
VITLSVLLQAPFLFVAEWGPVYLTSWRVRVTPADIARSVILSDDIHRRHPRYASVAIVGPDISLPDAETRASIRNAIIATAERDLFSVLVFDGPLAWAGAMRTMFASLLVVTGRRRRDRVTSSLEDAAELAHPAVQAPETPAALLAAMRQLRTMHQAP